MIQPVPKSDAANLARRGAWKRVLAGRTCSVISAWKQAEAGMGFGILMYHRICDSIPGVPEPTWNVPPGQLRKQLRGLQQRGYSARPLREMLERHHAGEAIPPRSFVVTFDDGYANNLHAALPVLRELQIPATVFLSTAYMDSEQPFPCDDWEAAGSDSVPEGSWRPLTWNEATELESEPLIEIGAHTHTHADFRGRAEDFRGDLELNCDILEARLGITRATFAFPFGTRKCGFSGGELAAAARTTSVRCALTTEEEPVTATDDPFDWGRFTADAGDTGATLAAKLSGVYTRVRNHIRQVKNLRLMPSADSPLRKRGKPASRIETR